MVEEEEGVDKGRLVAGGRGEREGRKSRPHMVDTSRIEVSWPRAALTQKIKVKVHIHYTLLYVSGHAAREVRRPSRCSLPGHIWSRAGTAGDKASNGAPRH